MNCWVFLKKDAHSNFSFINFNVICIKWQVVTSAGSIFKSCSELSYITHKKANCCCFKLYCKAVWAPSVALGLTWHIRHVPELQNIFGLLLDFCRGGCLNVFFVSERPAPKTVCLRVNIYSVTNQSWNPNADVGTSRWGWKWLFYYHHAETGVTRGRRLDVSGRNPGGGLGRGRILRKWAGWLAGLAETWRPWTRGEQVWGKSWQVGK